MRPAPQDRIILIPVPAQNKERKLPNFNTPSTGELMASCPLIGVGGKLICKEQSGV